MYSPETLLPAIIGGILPPVLWLMFWLREDRKNPEPTWTIATTFIYGMISVVIIYYPVAWFSEHFIGQRGVASILNNNFTLGVMIIVASVFFEEITKYIVAKFSALEKKDNDEPIDSVIYMITAALGFSAMENIMFLLRNDTVGSFTRTIVMINSRFIGATLLHVASSAILGIFLAISFYKGKLLKFVSLIAGIISAIILHSIFNFLIIKENNSVFFAFTFVWAAIFAVLIILERVKKIRK